MVIPMLNHVATTTTPGSLPRLTTSPSALAVNFPIELLELLPFRIYSKDRYGHFTYLNAACKAAMMLPSRSEAIGKTDFDYFDHSLAQAWAQQEQGLLSTGAHIIDQTEEERRIDGRRSWVRTSKFTFCDSTGQPAGIVGLTRDITSEHVAHEQYLHILDTVPTFIFVKTYDAVRDLFVFSFVNQCLANALGQPKHALLGKCDADLISNATEVALYSQIDHSVFHDGHANVNEEPFSHSTSGKRILSTIKVPITDITFNDGRRLGILGVSTDITEHKKAADTLYASQVMFDCIMRNVPAGLFFKDRDGRFITANSALATFLGTTPAEMIGKTDADYFDPHYVSVARAEELDILATGTPKDAVRPTIVRGCETIRSVSKVPVMARDNSTVEQILGISHDITTLMRSIDRAEQAEELLRHVLNTLPQKVFVKNLDGVFVLCNHTFAKHHGYSRPEEVVGKTDYDHWPSEQADAYRRKDEEIIKKNALERFLEVQIWRDGRRTTAETIKIPLHDPTTQEVKGVLGIYDDFLPVVDRQRVKKQTFTNVANEIRDSTLESRRRYLVLLGLTHIHGLEFNRAILWLYDSFLEQLSGALAIGQTSHPAATALRRNVPALERLDLDDCINSFDIYRQAPDSELCTLVQSLTVDLEPSDDIAMLLKLAESTGVPQVVPISVTSKSDDFRSILASLDATDVLLLAIPIAGGKSVLVCCDNVQSRSRIDGDLQACGEYADIIKRTLEDVYERDARLQQASDDRAWREVAWKVAHQLDSVVPSSADLLLKEILSVEDGDSGEEKMRAANLRLIWKNLEWARTLIKDLRGYSAPNEVIATDKMRVRDLVDGFGSLFRPRRAVVVECEDSIKSREILVDSGRMFECAATLAQNVDDLGDPSIAVTVSCRRAEHNELCDSAVRRGEWIRLDVKDNGPGVPIDQKKRIFEPFVSFGKGPHGTGFGLAQVRRIITSHGGYIVECGEEHEGADFAIYFRLLPSLENNK